jgi:quercetin dioxygenase-like cupin family protein
MVDDRGGDPACWAHLFDESEHGVVVDLSGLRASAGSGVLWSAPPGDLNVNLVKLRADEHIDEHRNEEVDVLVVVLSGAGEITIDDDVHQVTGQQLLVIPTGARRSIRASEWGLEYLSIHRARGPVQIKASPGIT